MSRCLRGLTILVMIGLPVLACVTGEAQIVPLLVMPLIVLGWPLLLALRDNPAGPEAAGGDDNDSDDGGGGNRRPDRRPPAPSGPTGVLPMEHSTPGSWRQRGNGRERVSDPGRRRQPHTPTPARTPRRVPAGPSHR